MKRIGLCVLVLFLVIAVFGFADRNLVRDSMIENTVLFFNSASLTIEGWMGSGVIVSPDGYIVTNRHVAGYYLERDGEDDQGNPKYKIVGDPVPRLQVYHRDWGMGGCRIVAVSNEPNKDLAVIKIEGIDPFTYSELATSKNMYEGDTVYSVGHPLGISWTITKGSISNFLELEDHSKWVLHDSSINPGNSGGPLYDEFGKVVGINFAAIPPFAAENMSVAIDARMVAQFVDLMINIDQQRMVPLSEDSFGTTPEPKYYSGYWYRGY